jgi:hypothetical protein
VVSDMALRMLPLHKAGEIQAITLELHADSDKHTIGVNKGDWSFRGSIDRGLQSTHDLNVAFNPRYLVELFESMSGLVTMQIDGPLKPGTFECKGISGLRHLLMPVQCK